MRTMVVVPTYLEAENIEITLNALRRAVPEADVLVVDDSSPDGTGDIVRAFAERDEAVSLLSRPEKEGLGYAYRAGFREALDRGYETICQMDADLSHDPDALPTLLAALDDGAAMVIGSRYVKGGTIPHWPWHRRALSKWGNRYTRIALGLPASDATSGYRAFRAQTLRDISFDSTRMGGYGFQIELAYRVFRVGGTIAEVPIAFTDRVRGFSKMSPKIMFEELWRVTWWGVRDRVLRRPPKW
ncbi:MAG TPA: polyprenol monophosphomannose synthase [Acidimicrobiales bacterium]|nr:polyprenol monophosphomannose synthase [Acidimicrobiales bacterium]